MPIPLTLAAWGAFVGRKSERVVVKQDGKVVQEVPFFRISEIMLPPGASISCDLIKEACARGIRIGFSSDRGKPYALLSTPSQPATVETRRAQFEALESDVGAELARACVTGKLRNQAGVLKYFHKHLANASPEQAAEVEHAIDGIEKMREQALTVKLLPIAEIRDTLRGIEGAAGRVYWDGVRALLDGKAPFPGRTGRGAVDPVNAMLNYGYGILYQTVWGAAINAGLEPFAGFLHVDRPGKPSLILDLIEEFRQPAVDRPVLAAIGRGETFEIEKGKMVDGARRRIAELIIERLDTSETFRGEKIMLRSIIQKQARSAAMFLRGRGDYKPYAFKW
jgi:CRISPR-associated protein Cas1